MPVEVFVYVLNSALNTCVLTVVLGSHYTALLTGLRGRWLISSANCVSHKPDEVSINRPQPADAFAFSSFDWFTLQKMGYSYILNVSTQQQLATARVWAVAWIKTTVRLHFSLWAPVQMQHILKLYLEALLLQRCSSHAHTHFLATGW